MLQDEGGWTPLVWAIENGHSNVVKLLLSSGADIHLRDAEGNVSIHWGAYSGNTEIIKLLLSRGADIEAVNELGMSTLLSYFDYSCFFVVFFVTAVKILSSKSQARVLWCKLLSFWPCA